MVYAVSITAALALGLGWVLQQRMAASAEGSQPLSLRLLLVVIRKPLWWAGIAAMAGGQVLGGIALNFGSVSLVDAILSTYLLFAFVIAALVVRWQPRWQEIVGAGLLSAALGVFVGIGHPRPHPHPVPWTQVAIAVGVLLVVVGGLVTRARRCGAVAEAVLIAISAGLLYGLQDASTRQALLVSEHQGVAGLVASPWPYIIVGGAALGVVLTQSAFRAARLDYSLPPATAAESLTGIALGIALLGDRLTVSGGALFVEAACAVALIGGVLLIGRSPALGDELGTARPVAAAQPRAES